MKQRKPSPYIQDKMRGAIPIELAHLMRICHEQELPFNIFLSEARKQHQREVREAALKEQR